MASIPPLTPLDIFGRNKTPDVIHAIQGKPVLAEYTLGEITVSENLISEEEIKLKLCNKIAIEIYSEKLIEFTKEHNHVTGDIRYRARIFAVPNADVQLLREQGII